MYYIISKESIGSCVRMRKFSRSDYIECVSGLSKWLSDDGVFVISEDENFIYMRGRK
jgi:hypothetical protein